MAPEVIAFFVALTPLVVILTTILQSRYDQWVARQKKKADDLAAATKAAADKKALEETAAKLATKTDETAQAITAKVETVHKAVNGEGLGGKLDAVMKWQREHDAQDNLRYDGLVAEILKLQGKPPAGA